MGLDVRPGMRERGYEFRTEVGLVLRSCLFSSSLPDG